jgi:transcriptional regulator with XRE-family HTH domain
MAKTGFGKLLRSRREAADQSMGALARHLGVSVSYLSDVERGHRAPLVADKIKKAAVFLNTDERPLLAAAAEVRGAFQLDVTAVSQEHRQVGAMLARQWASLSENQLEGIRELLGEEDGNGL